MTETKKQHLTDRYFDLLIHYDAGLTRMGASVTITKRKTGIELPMDFKGRQGMVKSLLEEFGTIEAVNKEMENYRASHF